RRVRAVRDVPRLGLREGPVDDLPAFRLAVARPVVGVDETGERGPYVVDGRRGVGRGDLGEATAGRVAQGEIEIDLERAAGPAGLRLADRLDRPGSGVRVEPAVRALRRREQAEVDERHACVDREELRPESMVGRDERGRIAAGEVAG